MAVATRRRRLMHLVAGAVAGTGLAFAAAGVIRLGLDPPDRPNPLGNGTAAVLLVGCGSLVATGVLLGFAALPPRRRIPAASRLVQGVAIAVAFGVLIGGIVRHDPRRDHLIVGVAALAVVLSWVARRFGRQADRAAQARRNQSSHR